MWESVRSETTRRLEQRMSERQDACRRGEERKSAVAEHDVCMQYGSDRQG